MTDTTGTTSDLSTSGESSLTGATPGRPFALVTGASSGIGLSSPGSSPTRGTTCWSWRRTTA